MPGQKFCQDDTYYTTCNYGETIVAMLGEQGTETSFVPPVRDESSTAESSTTTTIQTCRRQCSKPRTETSIVPSICNEPTTTTTATTKIGETRCQPLQGQICAKRRQET
jgi:hypothetical protein